MSVAKPIIRFMEALTSERQVKVFVIDDTVCSFQHLTGLPLLVHRIGQEASQRLQKAQILLLLATGVTAR